jgi:pilus assembly protein Flp/PilA
MNAFPGFLKNEDGATAIEYSLIAGLIALAVIALVRSIGGSLSTTFSEVNSGF